MRHSSGALAHGLVTRDDVAMRMAVVGALCRDRIVHEKAGTAAEQAGGGVLYGSRTAAFLGRRCTAVPLLAERDRSLLSALDNSMIDVAPCWTGVTTAFTLTYPADAPDARRVEMASEVRDARPDLSMFAAWGGRDAIHFAPLTPSELARGLLRAARSTFSGLVSLDAQGLVRGRLGDFSNELRGCIDVLKVDEDEARQLSGVADVAAAAAVFASWGIREVLVTRGSRGSLAFDGAEMHAVDAVTAPRVVDATGCGDTYVAAYLAARLDGGSVLQAARKASEVAAAKIGRLGPL